VVPDLQAAVGVVAAKDPADAQALKDVVLAAAQQVAEASKGVSPEEQQAVEKIRAALA
jgi:tellurite resistance protein